MFWFFFLYWKVSEEISELGYLKMLCGFFASLYIQCYPTQCTVCIFESCIIYMHDYLSVPSLCRYIATFLVIPVHIWEQTKHWHTWKNIALQTLIKEKNILSRSASLSLPQATFPLLWASSFAILHLSNCSTCSLTNSKHSLQAKSTPTHLFSISPISPAVFNQFTP